MKINNKKIDINKKVFNDVVNNGLFSIYDNHDNSELNIYKKRIKVTVDFNAEAFIAENKIYFFRDFNNTWFIDFDKWKENYELRMQHAIEQQKRLAEEQKQFKDEFNKDILTMSANEILNKYKLKTEIILMLCLDPSKKALFDSIKYLTTSEAKPILQKYEINGKWYWGLPEPQTESQSANAEESENIQKNKDKLSF